MAEHAEVVEEINDGNLFLRKISKEDVEFVFRSLNEKVITAYLSLGPMKTLEHSKRLIKGYLKYWDNYLQFNYIVELEEIPEDNKTKMANKKPCFHCGELNKDNHNRGVTRHNFDKFDTEEYICIKCYNKGIDFE